MVAPGTKLILSCGLGGQRPTFLWFKIATWVLTFFAYMTYHLSRKPISVAKHFLGCGLIRYIAMYDKHDWNTLLGWLDSSYLFAYAFGMFISGHVAERTNLRYFLTFGMISSGLFTAMFGVGRYLDIHVYGYYIAMQLISGFLQSTGWPSVVATLANWFGKGRRGLVMGVWNAHTSLGNILGGLIGGAFVEENWGLTFIVPGAIIAGMGVIIFFFLVPYPEEVGLQGDAHPALIRVVSENEEEWGELSFDDKAGDSAMYPDEGVTSDAEFEIDHNHELEPVLEGSVNPEQEEEPLLGDSTAVLTTSGRSVTVDTKAISIGRALLIPGVIEFALCLFFAKLVSYTFLFWLPFYIASVDDYSGSKSADLATVFDVGGIIGSIIAGLVSDATRGPGTVCTVSFILAAPALFVYHHVHIDGHELIFSVVMLLICGALVNGPYGLITTAVSADLGSHESLRGSSRALATVTAIIDGTGSVGAALGPLLTGWISQYDWNDVFYMLIVADILAMLCMVRIVVKEIRHWVLHGLNF